MVDLPLIIEEHRTKEARKMLMQISIHSLPYMEEQPRDEFLEGLRQQAGIVNEQLAEEPDVVGLERLKMMLGG